MSAVKQRLLSNAKYPLQVLSCLRELQLCGLHHGKVLRQWSQVQRLAHSDGSQKGRLSPSSS